MSHGPVTRRQKGSTATHFAFSVGTEFPVRGDQLVMEFESSYMTTDRDVLFMEWFCGLKSQQQSWHAIQLFS